MINSIASGLVIAEPWIDFILNGSKTWEMRSRPTKFRGWFALIRKGSGAICGIAHLVDVGQPLSQAELLATFDSHSIPGGDVRSGRFAEWNIPWKLGSVIQLDPPVRYDHPSGAVTWVKLDTFVTTAIDEAIRNRGRSTDHDALLPLPPVEELEGKEIVAVVEELEGVVVPDHRGIRTIGDVELTQGNIDNSHFYLRSLIQHFPDVIIGGSNKASAAAQNAVVVWGAGNEILTDIDGSKQFFRARSWIRKFFDANAASAGDHVRIDEIGPLRYRVALVR